MPTIFVDPFAFAVVALLNPAVPVVAVVLGRRADQWQKIVVAAFAAALAGIVLVWLATRTGLWAFPQLGRAAAGLFVAQFLTAIVWATAAYNLKRWP